MQGVNVSTNDHESKSCERIAADTDHTGAKRNLDNAEKLLEQLSAEIGKDGKGTLDKVAFQIREIGSLRKLVWVLTLRF